MTCKHEGERREVENSERWTTSTVVLCQRDGKYASLDYCRKCPYKEKPDA